MHDPLTSLTHQASDHVHVLPVLIANTTLEVLSSSAASTNSCDGLGGDMASTSLVASYKASVNDFTVRLFTLSTDTTST